MQDDPSTLQIAPDALSRYEKGYLLCATSFCVLLVLSNVIGVKFFKAPLAPDLALTSSLLTYPLTFLLSDLVTEIYGARRARLMVFLGFVMSVMTLGLVQAVLRLPPHPYWCTPGNPFGFTQSDQYQAAFYCVFGLSHLILFSSLLAYLAAQLVDVLLFDLIKRATKGRFLYLRNNLSTWAAQLIDTLIVNSLVFFIGMNIPVKMGFEIMGSCYLFKVVIACLETPLLYAAVRSLKKYLRHAA